MINELKGLTVNNSKTPSRAMAATITLILLLLFAASYIAPYLKVDWLHSETKPDPALQQNLLLLLGISVAYYIGSSKGSADANDAIRAQVVPPPPAAPAPPAPAPAPLMPTPPGPAPAPIPVVIANAEPVDVAVVADDPPAAPPAEPVPPPVAAVAAPAPGVVAAGVTGKK